MLVDFCHLASSPLERVLPRICEKVLADGGRLLVVAPPELGQQLDSLLWSYEKEAFLPHGRNPGLNPDRQPILISAEVEPINGATNVAIADGQWREEALAFERVFYFFDNGQRDAARGSWKMLKDKGDVERRYWKQDERGKWVQGP